MEEKTRLEKLLEEFNSDRDTAKELKNAARELVLEAKSNALKIKEQSDSKLGEVQQLENQLVELKEKYGKALTDLEQARQQEISALEKIATLSVKEVEEKIWKLLDQQLVEESAKRIRDNEDRIRAEAERRAREIIITAMQRVGTENVSEYTTHTIDLPNEEIKGRIIGKDGRNIKSFEDATGVGVEIGEAGEPTVTVSSFDPVKREVGRLSMEKLVADGRIQPSRIEEVVIQTKKEVDKILHEAGEDLLYRAGVTGLPIEIVDLLGRLKFRSSYGQNMIEHSLEVSRLGAALAAEVGADVELTKKASLLHDIGKAVSAETDKGHAEVGADICRRYGVPDEVVKSFEGHHTDYFPTLEAILVYLADAISGSRPGARKEDYEGYVQRVKELEAIATGFKGVERSFAISAGREVRVIVQPAIITDAEMVKLAHDIAHRIHEQIANFPGQIKVTVIREIKASALAKPKN
jgi:ribonuclease Y